MACVPAGTDSDRGIGTNEYGESPGSYAAERTFGCPHSSAGACGHVHFMRRHDGRQHGETFSVRKIGGQLHR
jgi:hypothetical protein